MIPKQGSSALLRLDTPGTQIPTSKSNSSLSAQQLGLVQLLKMPNKDIPALTQNKRNKKPLEMTTLLFKVRASAGCIWENIRARFASYTLLLLTKQRIHQHSHSSAERQGPLQGTQPSLNWGVERCVGSKLQSPPVSGPSRGTQSLKNHRNSLGVIQVGYFPNPRPAGSPDRPSFSAVKSTETHQAPHIASDPRCEDHHTTTLTGCIFQMVYLG